MSDDPQKPYIPPPSTGHELGIMFGFIGLMIISMVTYGIVWQIGNKRSLKKEQERIEQLKAAGLLKGEKYGLHEERREGL
jgi:hypothetical protein